MVILQINILWVPHSFFYFPNTFCDFSKPFSHLFICSLHFVIRSNLFFIFQQQFSFCDIFSFPSHCLLLILSLFLAFIIRWPIHLVLIFHFNGLQILTYFTFPNIYLQAFYIDFIFTINLKRSFPLCFYFSVFFIQAIIIIRVLVFLLLCFLLPASA